MARYKELVVWQRSMDLVDAIYSVTRTFPKDELFTLTSQMRRCAISIPSNLAEGCARKGKKEFLQFVGIAQGSLAELETQVLIARRQGLVTQEPTDRILLMTENIGKLLTRLAQSLKTT